MNLGSFRILLPFFWTSWAVGVLNSAIFNSFHSRVEFGTILEGLRNFGGGRVWTPPPRYVTVSKRSNLSTYDAARPQTTLHVKVQRSPKPCNFSATHFWQIKSDSSDTKAWLCMVLSDTRRLSVDTTVYFICQDHSNHFMGSLITENSFTSSSSLETIPK